MTYSYTQISQYLSWPRRSGTVTSTVGRKKTRARQCFLAAPSNRPSRA
jgi:hypothetical protein